MTFKEISDRAFPLSEGYRRYSAIMHGVGLSDESPRIPLPHDWAAKGHDGVVEADTVICVESYVGRVGGREGVKLEEQVLVKADGIEILSSFPYEDSLLA